MESTELAAGAAGAAVDSDDGRGRRPKDDKWDTTADLIAGWMGGAGESLTRLMDRCLALKRGRMDGSSLVEEERVRREMLDTGEVWRMVESFVGLTAAPCFAACPAYERAHSLTPPRFLRPSLAQSEFLQATLSRCAESVVCYEDQTNVHPARRF